MIYKKTLTALTALLCMAAISIQAAKEPSTYLSIQSQPDGAQITINHKARGMTPLTITDLPAGSYLIHAKKEGCSDSFETVSLQPGINYNINLELLPQRGLLLIESEPEGAEVTSESASLGITPLLITNLRPGKHRVSVALPGFQKKEIDITLKGRTPKKEFVTLVADSGTINIDSQPTGAEVLINGIARGNTPCKLDRIPGGEVKLEVRLSGYIPYLRDIALAAGEQQDVNLQLRPLPGNLSIVSIPSGARVYIENEFKKESPYILENAEPGNYRVRVELTGYTPIARDIEILKGISCTEEFRLTKNTGILSVITAPSGATILIDGRKKGITSSSKTDTSAVSKQLSNEYVMAGEHTIEIVRKGYGPQKRKITIKQDQTTSLQIKLSRQFIPNYEVTTTRSYYKGVLEFMNEEGIRIETAPGISQTIPMKDVKSHGKLRVE
jgi:hypothetical protein